MAKKKEPKFDAVFDLDALNRESVKLSIESQNEWKCKVIKELDKLNSIDEKINLLLFYKFKQNDFLLQSHEGRVQTSILFPKFHDAPIPFKEFVSQDFRINWLENRIDTLKEYIQTETKSKKVENDESLKIGKEERGQIQISYSYLFEIGIFETSFFKGNEFSQEFKIIILSKILGCSKRYAQKLWNQDADYLKSVKDKIKEVQEELRRNKKPS
jgi:hypothetical protein